MGFKALDEGEVAATENLHTDPELARGRAGSLHGALGATSKPFDVLDGGHGASTRVVIGMLGVGSHDRHERLGGDVVAPQHVTSFPRGGRQDDGDPVRTTTPSTGTPIGPRT
jgi:hypothetical protein